MDLSPPAAMAPAIVLGVDHPRAVAVVRSLGRMGVDVIAVEHDRKARGMRSRYIREKLLVGESHAEALATLESLQRHRGAVLIATNDHYVTLVAMNHERLARLFTLTIPRWEMLSRLMNKKRCYDLARSIGLQTPRFFTPETVEELDRVIAGLDFARHAYVLTKVLPTSAPTDGATGRYTRVAGPDAETMRARCLDVLARVGTLPMIAEVVPGESEACIGVSMILDRNGNAVAAYCVKRLQLRPYAKDEGFVHPYELGANVYCESTHDGEAEEKARTLLQAAGYFGTATVEFRRDASDGTLKLIKVDPRFVRASSLSTALGLDLPQALYRAFTSMPLQVPPAYAAGVSWIWLTWYLETVRNQGLRFSARRLWHLLGDARRIKAAAYLSGDDPLPFLVDVARWVPGRLRAEWRGLRRWGAKTVVPWPHRSIASSSEPVRRRAGNEAPPTEP